jgi:hypothetical protein
MIWIRISIHDGLAPNVLPLPSTVVYLIWFTNSEYLLTASIKKEWVDFIMEVHQQLTIMRIKTGNATDILRWAEQSTESHLLIHFSCDTCSW